MIPVPTPVPTPKSDEKTPFSRRELNVLQLIADGYSRSETAGKLGLAVKTVDFHMSNALRKAYARNAAHLIAECIRKEWLY